MIRGWLATSLAKVAQSWRKWRQRRHFTKAVQFEHLRIMIDEDWRWLAHDKVADALTTRYRRACSESWFQLEHESTDKFRRRIGLDPHVVPAPQTDNSKPLAHLDERVAALDATLTATLTDAVKQIKLARALRDELLAEIAARDSTIAELRATAREVQP